MLLFTRLLILKVNTVRKTINRKRFLGEHERTVNSFACRSVLNSSDIFSYARGK
ncbi:MAG: hypothetical protein FWC60_06240 [Firmicutes bacterium]|nr:hypothetical protein [Bacillota bacterium]